MIPDTVRRLAQRQHGVVGRTQVLETGVSRRVLDRLVGCRDLEPLHAGVYRVAGAPTTDASRIAAAVLAAGDHAVASHRAAAHLLGIGEVPLRIEVTAPHARRPRLRGVNVYRTRVLPRWHVAHALEIPVTAPARTICDLACVLGRDELELVLDHALVRRRVRVESVREVLAALSRREGTGTLKALLDARRDGRARVESPLEQKLQRLIEEEGITGGQAQHEVVIDGRRCRIDYAFPDARLALELDGYVWHGTRAAWESDHKRTAGLAAHGWRVLPVTQEDLDEGRARFVARLRRALAAEAGAA